LKSRPWRILATARRARSAAFSETATASGTGEILAGTVDLRNPKLHKESYFPGFLERRRMAERALTAVV
jgi:transposase-like protein